MPPALKQRTIEARVRRREEAAKEWSEALKKGMLEEARQHAMASTRINKEIVESSKRLLDLMGIAHIQAPSEGEAQASRLAADGRVYASASQDYDLFLFGSPIAVRNLTITGRRKLPRKNVFVEIRPERIELKRLLSGLGITHEQLVWLGMLVGTDFNEGVPGVGAKTALKLVRDKSSLQEVVSAAEAKYGASFEADPEEIESIFLNPEVREMEQGEFNSLLKDAKPDREALLRFMCTEHGFSKERVAKFADMLVGYRSAAGQKGMSSWV
jgi:flap endonuclease-1